MLLEIMCIVILSLIYLVARLKEIDFPAIAPTLRQMQYERLSPPRNRQIYFENGFITRLTGYEHQEILHDYQSMGINTWETRQERDDACVIIGDANPTTARFGRVGLSETDFIEIRELVSPDFSGISGNARGNQPRIDNISTELAQQEWWDFEDHRVTIMSSLVQRILQTQSESDVSQAAANGEIKPTGKSVSVEEVIAKIDENLKE